MTPIDRNRVLITGGNGMIGRAIDAGMKPPRSELDVCDRDAVASWMERNRPSAIIHLASMDLHRSESDPRAAMETNVVGTYNVGLAARDAGIPLVFFSSGAVFGGERGTVHDEESAPRPVNVYGNTKWLAETMLQALRGEMLIIRTGWVFGGSQAHHRKFVDIVIEKARSGEPITAACDRWGSPTFVRDVVAEMWRLLDGGQRGIVHVVNEGQATACDIAREIIAQLHSGSALHEVTQEELAPGGTPRAVSEILVSKHVHLRPWQEALREYVASRP
ncbi:MAG: dTDP-4-dehydrorhamnose reductase [Candidatus Peregrinibacteria bacterium Gr01-1014_25]|nr:MAG: dTDP-4-dehydrorhamnose reductase [Candidatus Peregrinibacteria bacterium Gr01-1014_25]